jgi:phosphohistidine phosphatase
VTKRRSVSRVNLLVMRHGPAEDHSSSGADGDRALTPKGRDRVYAVAKALVDAKEAPSHIVTSPLVRAVQTAEIVALVTGLGERGGTVDVRREIAPGGNTAHLVHKLASEGIDGVLLVGHEPDLSALIVSLVGRFGHTFEKAMVVGVHVGAHGGSAKQRFVLHPKSLEVERGGPSGG